MVEIKNDYGPIHDEEIITALENEVGYKLPSDYKTFIMKNNGGRPFPRAFKIPAQNDISSLDYIIPIENERRLYNMEYYLTVFENRFPSYYLPIGSDPFGNLILMKLDSIDNGSIYFWDHELESDNPELSENIFFIAGSFTEFINSLFDHVDEGDD